MRIQVVGGNYSAVASGELCEKTSAGQRGWVWLSDAAKRLCSPFSIMRLPERQRRFAWATARQPVERVVAAPHASARPDDEAARERLSSAALTPPTSAFDQFYMRNEQPLYGYLRRLAPSNEIAIELAQETFFRAWRHFDTVSAYERPEAWLYRVATNLALSHLRRRSPLTFSSIVQRTHSDGAADSEDGAAENLLPSNLDMERQTAERDQINRILRALPERQRAALLLAAVHGFTSDEIASALNISAGNARQMLSRARDRFRRLYGEEQHLRG